MLTFLLPWKYEQKSGCNNLRIVCIWDGLLVSSMESGSGFLYF